MPDLHGRLDLLEAAVSHLQQNHERWHVVFLGDAIDRGPQSLGVVARLCELHEAGLFTLVRGNHERFAEHVLHAPAGKREIAFDQWMRAGGLSVQQESGGALSPQRFSRRLERYLKLLWQVAWVDDLGRVWPGPPNRPSVLISHAVPPRPAWAGEHTPELWARPWDAPVFLPPGVRFSVHGHTPMPEVCRHGSQIYCDLGAYKTGRLALVPLQGATPQPPLILQGSGDARALAHLKPWGEPVPARVIRL